MIKMQKTRIPNLEQELMFDFEVYLKSTKALLEILGEIKDGQLETPNHSKTDEELEKLVYSNTGRWSSHRRYDAIKDFTEGRLNEPGFTSLLRSWYTKDLNHTLLTEQKTGADLSTEKKHLQQISTQPTAYFAEALNNIKLQLTSLVKQYEDIEKIRFDA